ncbi:MAG: bifunctional riboflavin kinase/FAD synthetase [Gammaproteobacteria bacterium]|nr:bifunctional riboflavin kinase/FAD synthetase [Gammaproteobacteria bacterium]
MKIIRGYHNTPETAQGCVVTLGNYDGVHKGHQAVLARLAEKAKDLNVPLVVMCFEPTPREFFDQDNAPSRLSNFREKAQLLAQLGVDYMLVQRFSKAFSALSADEFIENVLVQGLNVKAVVIGDDFRFGAGRCGDAAMLRTAGAAQGFEVLDTQTVVSGQERISSTAVRDCLACADLRAAEALLGRPYSIQGRVVHGDKLGRELGFPTANIGFARSKLPLQGVYAVKVYGVKNSGEPFLPGVANLGTRPAVNGVEQRLEVHLIGWNGDVYGQRLTVEFSEFIRPEQRFACLEELTAAIADDVEQGARLFGLLPD